VKEDGPHFRSPKQPSPREERELRRIPQNSQIAFIGMSFRSNDEQPQLPQDRAIGYSDKSLLHLGWID